jgi:acetoin utilization deacetylase AcuC-like enzyme
MSDTTPASTRSTGIFYHPSFSRRSYLTQGSRLQNFPEVLGPLLKDPRFRLYESPPVDEELILRVHGNELLRDVKLDPLCSTAWHSVGGVLLAGEKIAAGEIRNAFAFIGAGGHHSGRDFFGGYCCFNDVVITIAQLRDRFKVRRFAILDTDAHHGDGTRDLLRDDPDVLHVCICSSNYESADGTKVDVAAGSRPWHSPLSLAAGPEEPSYFEAASGAFVPRVRDFKPDFIFWYFGFDTHKGDYGDIGLELPTYLEICRMVKKQADELCDGRLEVVLGGGSRSEIARNVIPPVISVLGEETW